MIDVLATAHLGVLRTTPPRGVEPVIDTLLDAHFGWYVIASGPPSAIRADVIDGVFCVTLHVTEDFGVATGSPADFCVVLVDDDEVLI